MAGRRFLKVIHSRAPLRINDIGGWTDTWFAGTGTVLNLAVDPPVEVQVKVLLNREGLRKRAEVFAENYDESFRFDPDRPRLDRHPLLQHTVAAIPVPDQFRLEVRIFSPVPAGISTGTSASVAVALLGALNLAAGGRRSPLQIAALPVGRGLHARFGRVVGAVAVGEEELPADRPAEGIGGGDPDRSD